MMKITWVDDDSYAAAAQEDRSAPRTRINVPARLRPTGYKRRNVFLRNISLSGFSVASIDRLPAHTRCRLTIPEVGRFDARSIWWEQGRGGGFAFEQLLDSRILATIIARSS
ncbi:PilZ domain-containing protein [Novosphingobium sp. 9U]|uniref:PilZ domain-containing protein n=1 Tax=Novosphingobium sp. 9U TaxID=2653158 RepID=UPI00352EC3E9